MNDLSDASLLQAVRYLRRTARSLRVLKIAGPVVGTVMIASSEWLGSSATGQQAVFWAVLFWTGLLLTAFSALFLAFVDETAPEILHSNIKLSETVSELSDDLEFYHSYIDHLLARTSLTSVMREMLEVALLEEGWDRESQAQYALNLLEFMAERKTGLFGMDDEYWNFSVYTMNEGTGALTCIACKRASKADSEKEHRDWAIGEGHVGLAFARGTELVFADATSEELQPVIAATGAKARDYDKKRYVSLAAVPISTDYQEILGILVATSDVAGRFKNAEEREEDENDWERVDVLREAASYLAILMKTAHTTSSVATSTTHNQGQGSQDAE